MTIDGDNLNATMAEDPVTRFGCKVKIRLMQDG